jgi:hypothetical protein
VIVADATGRPQFYDLLRGTRAPVCVAFDIPWLNGTDLRPLPLSERRRRLQAILPAGSPTISLPLSVAGRRRELFELMCANDLEGIVAKRLHDPYDARVRWLKIKTRITRSRKAEPSCLMARGTARRELLKLALPEIGALPNEAAAQLQAAAIRGVSAFTNQIRRRRILACGECRVADYRGCFVSPGKRVGSEFPKAGLSQFPPIGLPWR